MFNVSPLNDEHDCNVVSMLSMNIHYTSDDCTRHDKNISYKHVNFCGVQKFVKTCLIGMIDFVRGINMINPIGGLK